MIQDGVGNTYGDPADLKGDKDLGNSQVAHHKSDIEMAFELSKELDKIAAKLNDNTVSLAVKAIESRRFLDWHTDNVRSAWLDWEEQSKKVMESIRQCRVAIGFESKQLLAECGDVRKFFLSQDHDLEIQRLKEFVELAERLKALKADGTLDVLADTILKL